jgi:hypothetical protein
MNSPEPSQIEEAAVAERESFMKMMQKPPWEFEAGTPNGAKIIEHDLSPYSLPLNRDLVTLTVDSPETAKSNLPPNKENPMTNMTLSLLQAFSEDRQFLEKNSPWAA